MRSLLPATCGTATFLLAAAAAVAGAGSSSCREATVGDELEPESTTQALASCVAGVRPTTGLALERALPALSFSVPVAMLQAPGNASRFYVVEKAGVIRLAQSAGASTTSVFADLRSRVNAQPNEAGLLGVAFHPRFAQNGQVFLSYTTTSPVSPTNLRSVIARAKTSDGGATLDLATLTELLTVEQPYSNHNGGHIAFGADGKLYVGFGDGGSGGDPQGNGQNKNVLLGKILRIDVDGTAPYTIPPSNPFARGGGRPEIFAYGFRNPWRFSFDRVTGELWAGDVGQSKWEEVDRVVVGGNYGWNTREGNHCYAPTCTAASAASSIPPVAEYGRSEGISITGGFVYRGSAIPALVGQYLYGDFGSGRIWALPVSSPTPTPTLVLETGKGIASFAEDASGELYILDYRSGQPFRIVATTASNGIPGALSQTGCFVASNPTLAAAALVPYDVNSPLWSDAADKARWMAIPAGRKIEVQPDGDWVLPIGSVLAKTFSIAGTRIETRLFLRHLDGGWAGYTYEWNAAQTDAVLLDAGKTRAVGARTWTIPSRAECMTCHTSAAGGSLGLETAQLDRAFTYPDGSTQNQLARLEAMGLFSATAGLPPAALRTPLPRPTDTTSPVEARARSYLHANCSFCHRPQGTGRGSADLRWSAVDTGLCDRAPEAGSLGVVDARLVAPGQPGRSLLSVRMRASGEGRMPPLGSGMVDAVGVGVIDPWIAGMTATSCR